MDNEAYVKTLDEQISKAEGKLKEALWVAEQLREVWIQLKVQKTMIFIAQGVGTPR